MPKVYLSEAAGLTFPPIAPVAIMASSPAEEFIKRHFGWFSVQHNILFMCTPFTQRRMRHRSTGSSDMFLSFNFMLTTTGRSRCWTDISDIHDISANTGTGRSRRPSKSSCVSINTSTGRSTGKDCKSDTVHGWTDRSPDTGTGDRL